MTIQQIIEKINTEDNFETYSAELRELLHTLENNTTDEISLFFQTLLNKEFYDEVRFAFSSLLTNSNAAQVLDAYDSILASIKNPDRFYIVNDIFENIIKTKNNSLIKQAFKQSIAYQNEAIIRNGCVQLVKEGKADLIEQSDNRIVLTDREYSLAELLSRHSDSIEALWQLQASNKLSLSRPSIRSIQELLNGENNYELFLVLAHHPELTTEKDNQGDTLLHVYTKMRHFEKVSLHLLAFAPHLDLSLTDNEGNNALHIGIDTPLFNALLKRENINYDTFHAPNSKGITPLDKLLTSLCGQRFNARFNAVIQKAFSELAKKGTSQQILSVYTQILNYAKHIEQFYVASNAFAQIIQKNDSLLIKKAVEKTFALNLDPQFICNCFVQLAPNNNMELIQAVINYKEKEYHLAELLVQNRNTIDILWQLHILGKLSLPGIDFIPKTKTKSEYFKKLLDHQNSYELFLALANNPHLINKKDENGDTLLHVYVKSGYFDPITGRILAFAPHLDLNNNDNEGNNALHMGVNAYYARGIWYHEKLLEDLLKRTEKNHTALNWSNKKGVTPLGRLLTHDLFFNENQGYNNHPTMVYALKLFNAGSDPLQPFSNNEWSLHTEKDQTTLTQRLSNINVMDILNDTIQTLTNTHLKFEDISFSIDQQIRNLTYDPVFTYLPATVQASLKASSEMSYLKKTLKGINEQLKITLENIFKELDDQLKMTTDESEILKIKEQLRKIQTALDSTDQSLTKNDTNTIENISSNWNATACQQYYNLVNSLKNKLQQKMENLVGHKPPDENREKQKKQAKEHQLGNRQTLYEIIDHATKQLLHADKEQVSSIQENLRLQIQTIINDPDTLLRIQEVLNLYIQELTTKNIEQEEFNSLLCDLTRQLKKVVYDKNQNTIHRIIHEELRQFVVDNKLQSTEISIKISQKILNVINASKKQSLDILIDQISRHVSHIANQQRSGKEWITFKNILELTRSDIHKPTSLYVQSKFPQARIDDFDDDTRLDKLKAVSKVTPPQRNPVPIEKKYKLSFQDRSIRDINKVNETNTYLLSQRLMTGKPISVVIKEIPSEVYHATRVSNKEEWLVEEDNPHKAKVIRRQTISFFTPTPIDENKWGALGYVKSSDGSFNRIDEEKYSLEEIEKESDPSQNQIYP
ncbi:hypothetical protein [Legionella fairfieldensis]|uniref:hypothetical protein n=1 Tax=Legionella fairfieldensis TaxID=45064 RepID=UPI00048D222D|nr:hypothetical protein [Legionella fairfieldensis]